MSWNMSRFENNSRPVNLEKRKKEKNKTPIFYEYFLSMSSMCVCSPKCVCVFEHMPFEKWRTRVQILDEIKSVSLGIDVLREKTHLSILIPAMFFTNQIWQCQLDI